jgi:hypothetical protein
VHHGFVEHPEGAVYHFLSLLAAFVSLFWVGFIYLRRKRAVDQAETSATADTWHKLSKRASETSTVGMLPPAEKGGAASRAAASAASPQHRGDVSRAQAGEAAAREAGRLVLCNGHWMASHAVRRLQVTCLESQIVLAALEAEEVEDLYLLFLLYPIVLHILDFLIDWFPRCFTRRRMALRVAVLVVLHVTPAIVTIVVVAARGIEPLGLAESLFSLLLLNVPYLLHLRHIERPAVLRWRIATQAILDGRHKTVAEETDAEMGLSNADAEEK